MSTEKNASKKGRKPDQQAKQPLVPHGPDGTPGTTDLLIQKLMKAHDAFSGAFCKSLWFAKGGGDIVLTLQVRTGLKGAQLFAYIRKHAKRSISDRSLFLYLRIASRWNELQIKAGDKLTEMTLSQAIKLLQQSKDEKPPQQGKDKATPAEAKPKAQSASNAAPSPGTKGLLEGESNAKPNEAKEKDEGESDAKPQEGQEAAKEEPISVQLPFDQPRKDRLAAVYAQNGPASTPIQLMTNIIIPVLKKVAEGGVSENEVPFLANAIKEALALIEVLKQKYAIS
jgi:hypothetical protein